ncbi:MAG: PHB depolymerase family esterase [Parasphingorhabdus sp.]|uniref:alpha/beta hydrolase family esterase n=1 Tax=Parasphingorhabdus sp. TaxID=2709688 RepID=UPI0032973845
MHILFRALCSAAVIGLAGSSLSQVAQAQNEAEPEGILSVERFPQDKQMRRYRLYSPASVDKFNGSRPLVLVIHGGGSTDRGMLKLDKGQWNALAEKHGFYVAYPNAVDKIWDFGEGLTSEARGKRVDDLAYFSTVIDRISNEKNIDQQRIFATGISRGGQASYFLACNLTDRIRAIAPVAMSLPTFMTNECRSAFLDPSASGKKIGLAVMNGTADPQVPYKGGWITVFRKKRDIVMATEQTIAFWRKLSGCKNSGFDQTTVDQPGDKTSVTIKSWTQRCETAPVKLYTINNGGHTWPSGLQYLSPRIVGETSKDISAAGEAWSFFSQF